MTDAAHDVMATLDDDTGGRSVDIIRQTNGQFTYIEYARDPDDPDAWHARDGATAKTYPTQYAAYADAMRDIDWLMD